LSFVEQACLLRSGLEFLAKAAAQNPEETWVRSTPAREIKTAAIKAREAQAKRFAENPDKPKRSVLSLKKSH
jgi:hypothetical protein